MIALAQEGFQHLGSFADRLDLLAKHIDPRWGVMFPGDIQGLTNAIGHHQAGIKDVHGRANLAHGLPLDALASLAACAAAGLALSLSRSEQAFTFPLGFFVDCLLFRSGELG